MAKKINFLVEALTRPGNLAFVVFAGVVSLIVGGTTGLVVAGIGAGFEGLYLALRSGSRSFRRQTLRRLGWGGEVLPAQLDRLADGISADGAERYQRFRRQVNAVVDAVEGRELEEDPLLAGVLANLQSMSLTYLQLLHSDRELERLAAAPSEQVAAEIAELEAKLAQATDPTLRQTLEQNRALLIKRRDRTATAADKRRRLAAQLDLMDSTVNLLREQAAEMTQPADITAQVDAALGNMNDAHLLQGELNDLLLDRPPVAPRVRQGSGS